MKIPLPERINPYHTAFFATTIFCLQVVEGTDLVFAGLFWLYLLAATTAFNVCGGLVYPSGSFVFFNSILTCILGLVYKVILGEPGDSNLIVPRVTMEAYLLGMVMTICAAALSRRISPRRGILANLGDLGSYQDAALGAFVCGAAFDLWTYRGVQEGTFASAFRQINSLGTLAIVLATFATTKRTKGVRSANWVVITGIAFGTLLGLLSASKQGLSQAAVAWLVTAVVAGHTFTRRQILGIVLGGVFFTGFLTPYSQVARNTKAETRSIRSDWENAMTYLPDLGKTRESYIASQLAANEARESYDTQSAHFFNQPQGLLDRLNMMAPDDALIAITVDGTVEGLYPTYFSFVNLVPRFLWRTKPIIGFGNRYAHEMGGLADDDDSTGVSFSPTADAFHQAEFMGVFILVPFILFLLFLSMDSLSGDIRKTPWGILLVVANAHSAPEGLLGGQLYVATYTCFGVVVVALFTGYVLPVITRVFTNQDRTRVDKGIEFKPIQTRSSGL